MIIKSLLEQDLYKFTMGQCVFHHFTDFMVRYKFKCRNKGIKWTDEMMDEIEAEIRNFCNLKFTDDEITYLSTLQFTKSSYLNFLKLYKPDIDQILLYRDLEGQLQIEIEGPWFLTIYFEIPILAIVNEVYFKATTDVDERHKIGIENLTQKMDIADKHKFPFSDFGLRRRYSSEWQRMVVGMLKSLPNFTGTSNVYLAKRYDIKPIGTMAHEFVCAMQAVDDVTLSNSQKYALQKWMDEYRGYLGIALSDTLGFNKFLKDFDPYFAKLYDGVRHDSGDPFEWGEKMIDHYEKMGIDPKTKSFVFSDGLDFLKAKELWDRFRTRTKVSFGIGTNLMNDMGVEPLNIVIKMVAANGRPVAKLSDSPGKLMCENEGFVNYLKSII